MRESRDADSPVRSGAYAASLRDMNSVKSRTRLVLRASPCVRIQSVPYTCNDAACLAPTLATDKGQITDALGGRAYYMGRLELEFPTSSGLKSLGLRPSAFIDAGSLWLIKQPILLNVAKVCAGPAGSSLPLQQISGESANLSCTQFNVNGVTTYADNATQTSAGRRELFLGGAGKPRLSIGVGVNWTSPFGPLRLDIAKALLKQKGDDTKLFSFNVGTQF